jgi:cytochrome c peroxidase
MGRRHIITIVILGLIMTAFSQVEFAGFSKPANFPEPVYDIKNNPVTKEGFELGRQLFYEAVLSRDNSISCGNCHVQASGFTQHGHDLSHGIEDRLGNRNSPPIMNLAWNKSFMWDGGVFHLELFPLAPITNPVEMDEKMDNVLAKLRSKKKYRDGFLAAYGDEEITGKRVFNALTQFMLMCISDNSKYDSVMRKSGPKFTELEQRGYQLFRAKCSSCHKEPLFTDGSFRNNGLDNTYNPDSGRQAITLDSNDRFKFKVPSLRNNAYTAPYMHDGRFTTLDQVLNHYSGGVKNSHTLDPLLRKNGIYGIPLTGDEKTVLKAFLNTLNDKYFITRTDLSENNEKTK